MTVPLSPGRQAQPDGTLIPDERVGQATAAKVSYRVTVQWAWHEEIGHGGKRP